MSPYVGYQETLVHLPCNESKCLALHLVLGKLGTFRMTVASSWNARVRMKDFAFTRWAISKVYPGLDQAAYIRKYTSRPWQQRLEPG